MRKFLRDMLLFSFQNELLCNSSNAPNGFFGEIPVLAYSETFDNEGIVKMLQNPNINPEIICHMSSYSLSKNNGVYCKFRCLE